MPIGNAFVRRTRGRRFKAQLGQIGESGVNVRHRCDISLKGNVLLVDSMTWRWTSVIQQGNNEDLIENLLFNNYGCG